jgi:hypothetical protein
MSSFYAHYSHDAEAKIWTLIPVLFGSEKTSSSQENDLWFSLSCVFFKFV